MPVYWVPRNVLAGHPALMSARLMRMAHWFGNVMEQPWLVGEYDAQSLAKDGLIM